MYNFKIAIPTYSRCNTLFHKSLGIIERNNFPPEKLFIFVVEDQLEDYKKTISIKYWSCFVVGAKEKGLVAQRNFMTNYFEQDEPILYMDDDLKDIRSIIDTRNTKRYPLENFNEVFHLMKEEGVSLCGFYPVPNAYFANHKRVKGLVYVTGGLYCVFNKKDIELKFEFIEDFERTARYYASYGPVLRLNHIYADTRGFRGKGGMNSNRRDPIDSLECCLGLQAEYPELVEDVKQLKNGFFNPVFKKEYAKKIS